MTIEVNTTRRKAEDRTVTKISVVTKLLKRKQGASLDELVKPAGWQPHTTRAALTGLRKRGYQVERGERAGKTCYSLVEPTKP
ncbi:DUF3489 domain-containing protein [Altererythrobacter sp. BO-6]|uniref:DUF3489 domain-containing protein n=1 Tax=Altererythrobacter sp. BO-6 TaxID=2604537 RepID=UPI0013E1F5B1|nr:DUF3489 domain-containing protein [Altererythrobacter sp. BO-6]QIG54751.1 DUF3489 domain-containing protein [Altererythrobacter sp. BO-6]